MTVSNLAPIVLFVYNRPWHTEQTLNALMQNDLADQSILYIFADGTKTNATEDQLQKIKDVREIIRAKQWCKRVHIIESENNKGLANSVIAGVTDIVNKHGKVIVLEDDLVTAKGFLSFMNYSLSKYEEEIKVMQVSGFNFPLKISHKNSAHFLLFASSWGWATWKRAWIQFDAYALGYERLKVDKALEDKFNLNQSYPYSLMLFNQIEQKLIDSWAIRWWWSIFKNDGLSLFPDKSLVKNIGYDENGTHTKEHNPYSDKKFNHNYYINNYPDIIVKNSLLEQKLENYLKVREGKNKNSIDLSKVVYRKIKSFFN